MDSWLAREWSSEQWFEIVYGEVVEVQIEVMLNGVTDS